MYPDYVDDRRAESFAPLGPSLFDQIATSKKYSLTSELASIVANLLSNARARSQYFASSSKTHNIFQSLIERVLHCPVKHTTIEELVQGIISSTLIGPGSRLGDVQSSKEHDDGLETVSKVHTLLSILFSQGLFGTSLVSLYGSDQYTCHTETSVQAELFKWEKGTNFLADS